MFNKDFLGNKWFLFCYFYVIWFSNFFYKNVILISYNNKEKNFKIFKIIKFIFFMGFFIEVFLYN